MKAAEERSELVEEKAGLIQKSLDTIELGLGEAQVRKHRTREGTGDAVMGLGVVQVKRLRDWVRYRSDNRVGVATRYI